jgi:hypothetical protein
MHPRRSLSPYWCRVTHRAFWKKPEQPRFLLNESLRYWVLAVTKNPSRIFCFRMSALWAVKMTYSLWKYASCAKHPVTRRVFNYVNFLFPVLVLFLREIAFYIVNTAISFWIWKMYHVLIYDIDMWILLSRCGLYYILTFSPLMFEDTDKFKEQGRKNVASWG